MCCACCVLYQECYPCSKVMALELLAAAHTSISCDSLFLRMAA
jgi:hypothetical protein